VFFYLKRKKERLIEKTKTRFFFERYFWHIAKKCVFLFSKNPSFYFSKLFNSFPSLIESTKKHRVVALRKPELKSFLEELRKNLLLFKNRKPRNFIFVHGYIFHLYKKKFEEVFLILFPKSVLIFSPGT
jgi:hypothetical protein